MSSKGVKARVGELKELGKFKVSLTLSGKQEGFLEEEAPALRSNLPLNHRYHLAVHNTPEVPRKKMESIDSPRISSSLA